MADMEKQIRALETRRRAGEKVPELDVLYSKMDADTNKGHDAATKKQPPAQPPKPSMFKRIFGIPTGQERTDKLKQDIEKMKKGGSVKKYETGGSVDTAPTTKTTVGGRKPPSMPPARYPNPKDDVDEYKPPYVDPRVELGLKGMKYLKEKFNLKKTGGSIKSYAKGGSVSSRGDGVAQRGKTKGRFV